MTQAIKKYAVIKTDQQEVDVILSSWLEEDNKVFWRPELDIEYKDAVLNELEVGDDWEHLRCDKILKYFDTYVDAIAFSKLGKIHELSDAADSDKVRNSRSDRNKKSNLLKNNGKTSKSVKNTKESKKTDNIVVENINESTNINVSSESEDDDIVLHGKRVNNDENTLAPNPKKFKSLLSSTESPSTSTTKTVTFLTPEPVEPLDPEMETTNDNDDLVLDDILRKFTVDGEVKTERMIGALFVVLKQTNKQMTQLGLKFGALERKVNSSLAKQPAHSFSPSIMSMSQYFKIKNLDEMDKIEARLEEDENFATNVRIGQNQNIFFQTAKCNFSLSSMMGRLIDTRPIEIFDSILGIENIIKHGKIMKMRENHFFVILRMLSNGIYWDLRSIYIG